MYPITITVITLVAIAAALYAFRHYPGILAERNQLREKCGQFDAQCTTLREENARVRSEIYAEVGEHYSGMMDRLYANIRRLNGYAFRVPSGPNSRILNTPIGMFAIRTAKGYFAETAILVYFPIGFGFSQEIADALRVATNGRFVMNRAPGNSSGGDDLADAIISAGLDYNAYLRDEQGYFKVSTPPTIDEIVEVLSRIIVYPTGVTANP